MYSMNRIWWNLKWKIPINSFEFRLVEVPSYSVHTVVGMNEKLKSVKLESFHLRIWKILLKLQSSKSNMMWLSIEFSNLNEIPIFWLMFPTSIAAFQLQLIFQLNWKLSDFNNHLPTSVVLSNFCPIFPTLHVLSNNTYSEEFLIPCRLSTLNQVEESRSDLELKKFVLFFFRYLGRWWV